MYEVIKYSGSNDDMGTLVGRYPALGPARRAAARALGRTSLRGASRWKSDGGLVYQFGPRSEANDGMTVEVSCV